MLNYLFYVVCVLHANLRLLSCVQLSGVQEFCRKSSKIVFLSISLVLGPRWISNGQFEQQRLLGRAGVSSLHVADICMCMGGDCEGIPFGKSCNNASLRLEQHNDEQIGMD